MAALTPDEDLFLVAVVRVELLHEQGDRLELGYARTFVEAVYASGLKVMVATLQQQLLGITKFSLADADRAEFAG